MSRAGPDPRERITPESFAVAPHLVGVPLARPGRRAAAILVDLVVLGLLRSLGATLLFLGGAAAFFWLAYRSRRQAGARRQDALPFTLVGGLLLVIGLSIAGARVFSDDIAEEVQGELGSGRLGTAGANVGLAIAIAAETQAVRTAPTEAEARAAAGRMAEHLRRMGVPPHEVRKTLLDQAGDVPAERPWAARALREVAAGLPAAPADSAAAEPASDSLARAYAAALAAGDSAAVGSLRPRLAAALASDSLRALATEVEALRASNRGLRQAAKAAREKAEENERGWLDSIIEFADDLGIGFGWSALYFTVLTAVWRGQTPGKRLLGIRVVPLNGKPLTWWLSFERFGGYAAGFATGLLGFLQVFWDRNRQAIHDKITETVVIHGELPAAPAPVPAPTPQMPGVPETPEASPS